MIRATSQSTHWAGCWDSGRRHYECAMAEIARLIEAVRLSHEQVQEHQAEIAKLRCYIAELEKVTTPEQRAVAADWALGLAHEFTPV